MRRVIKHSCMILSVLVTITLGWLSWNFAYVMSQQIWLFQPRDTSRLALRGLQYSPEGIVVKVHAPSGVARVWRQRETAIWQRWPWTSPHYPIAARVVEQENAATITILVHYPFRPGEEWFLCLESEDGYWDVMSPYFPDTPDLSTQEWNRLVRQSKPLTDVE